MGSRHRLCLAYPTEEFLLPKGGVWCNGGRCWLRKSRNKGSHGDLGSRRWGLVLTRLATVPPPPSLGTTMPQFPYPGGRGRVCGSATHVSFLGEGGPHKMWPLRVSPCTGEGDSVSRRTEPQSASGQGCNAVLRRVHLSSYGRKPGQPGAWSPRSQLTPGLTSTFSLTSETTP